MSAPVQISPRVRCTNTPGWTTLRWFDGVAREGVPTPGHHVSDAFGQFPTTPEMTRTGSATVAWPRVR